MAKEFTWERELIRHEAFLRRLAASLVADPSRADDLVQETYVIALQQRPDRPAAIRAWLATVVRRLAGRTRRAERRRTAREERVARPLATHESSLDARMEAHAELLSHLRSLPKPEAEVLFLRYGEDLHLGEIATRLDLSPHTVKTRLRRGRERLRQDLDASYGGPQAWHALFLPLAKWPQASPAGLTLSPIKPVLIGLSFMNVKLIGLLASAALVLWIGLSLRTSSAPSSEALSGPKQVEDQLDGFVAVQSVPNKRKLATEAASLAPKPLGTGEATTSAGDPGPEWWVKVNLDGPIPSPAQLKVHVKFDSWGEAEVDPIQVAVMDESPAWINLGTAIRKLESKGNGRQAGYLTLKLIHPDLLPREVEVRLPDPRSNERSRSDPFSVSISARQATTLTGSVLGPDHQALGGDARAVIYALQGDRPLAEIAASGHVEDGQFRLLLDAGGRYALAIISHANRPATRLLDLPAGQSTDLGAITLETGASIEGRVFGSCADDQLRIALDHDGTKLRLPQIDVSGLGRKLTWRNQRFEIQSLDAPIGALGAYRATGLAPLPYTVTPRGRSSGVPFRLNRSVSATAPASLDLHSPYAGFLLKISLPDGTVAPAARTRGSIRWQLGDQTKAYDLELQPNANEWSYCLPPDEPLSAILEFPGYRRAVLDEAPLTIDESRVREVVLIAEEAAPTGSLVLELSGFPLPDGTPVRLRSNAYGSNESKYKSRVYDNRFRLTDIPAGEISMDLVIGSDWFAPQSHYCIAHFEAHVIAEQETHVSINLEIGGTLIAQVVDDEGNRMDAQVSVRDALGESQPRVFVANLPDGRIAAHNFVFASAPSRLAEDLPPGHYTLHANASGFAPNEAPFVIQAGKTTELTVTLQSK